LQALATNDPIDIRTRLQDATGQQVHDSGLSTGWKWDTNASTAMKLPQQTGSGLTGEQAQQLSDTWNWVQHVFTDVLGGLISTPIGSALVHPDQRFQLTSTECTTLTGRGSLQRGGLPGIGVNAFGLQLSAAQVPPGMSVRDGVILRYRPRLAQLAAVYQHAGGGTQRVLEVLELDLDNFCWLWKEAGPFEILYDITPGCAVQACWILASL
jgi:hypothetical protein